MNLIKLEFKDADRKCYTNVTEYKFEPEFLIFTINIDGQPVIKAIPVQRIKHVQIEQQL